MLKPVLLILHQEHSSPGRVGQVLSKLGYPLDIRRPRFGDSLPDTSDMREGAMNAVNAVRENPLEGRLIMDDPGHAWLALAEQAAGAIGQAHFEQAATQA